MLEKMEVTGTITHQTTTPVSVKLTRGQRGGYGWEIEVRGITTAGILEQIYVIDQQLRVTYSSQEV